MLAAQVAPGILAADRFQESEARANTDALTGLLNRRQLADDILEQYASALERGRPLSVVMIDVDWFKVYNDGYGHGGGDEALLAIADAALYDSKVAGRNRMTIAGAGQNVRAA